ncbi:MAG: hypothetical protein HFI63_06145 [Lachnospiraceae bacterium]|nr:hypothetical protein [Lachnospiraceae bacterium]
MKEFRIGCLVVFLAVCSGLDIRFRRFPLWFLLTGVTVGTLLEMAENGVGIMMLCNLVPGVALILIALAVPEQLGIGDGWMLMGAGAFAGWAEGLFLLENGLLFMLPVSFFQLIVRRRKKMELPFAPFVLAACLFGTVFFSISGKD